jgi:hypothetical protein
MKFFFVVGDGDGDGDVELLGLGDVEPDGVGVIVGDGVAVPVADGECDADGELLGATAPPTAIPSTHVKTYSVAPSGGFTITGLGEVAGELLGTTGADAMGADECFDGVGRGGGGVTLGGGLVGVPFSGVMTGSIGFAEAELADAAEADWAATCWLMTPCGVTRPWLPLTSRPTRCTAVRVTAVMTTHERNQPRARVSGRPAQLRLPSGCCAGRRNPRYQGPRGPELGSFSGRSEPRRSGPGWSDTPAFSADWWRYGVKGLSSWRANLGTSGLIGCRD